MRTTRSKSAATTATTVTVVIAAFAALVAGSGCASLNPTGGAAAQLAAGDFNNNTRFGRMELASEQVMPENQKAFFEQHKGWGGRVRIADAEMIGMKAKKDDDYEISVRVSWFRIDEEELHLTTLKQLWHDNKGMWKVMKEERTDGDLGLLGERVEQPTDAPLHENVHYATVRIGQR